MEQKKIRWGLLGAGAILDRFMNGAKQWDDMEVVAIASRTPESAKKMAEKYDVPEVLTYDGLLAREDIDVVYIPVPHTIHKELAIKAMKAKKAVLVEKPAGINASEWKEMVACAKEENVFLMEASWTRFFPIIARMREIIAEGRLGDIRAVSSDFSFRTDDPNGRLLDPNRAGGGLLDVGVYNFQFQRMVFDKAPVKLIGLASMDTDEMHLQVDEQASYIAQYDRGELGTMSSGVRTDMIDTAYIYGTKGYIVMPQFWKPFSMDVTVGTETEHIEIPVPQRVEGVVDEGYQYEIAHVNECLRAGLKESPIMTFEITDSVLTQCDQLREQWGLKYPQEM